MGTKSKKKAKTRLDAYYRLAKDQGYRSRAAFKLIQLNRKYDFLAKSKVLVDLCAAPGGWLQVAAKHMPVGSKIVGIDLVPIQPVRGCKTFVGDITDDKSRKMIVTWLKKEPVDIVIHDGAPNVGGVWSRDLFEQNALVLASCKMACSMLRLGGWFVTKVFRSPDFQKLMWVMKQLFDKVEATKPLASRMESAEIFVVCAGYKAPKTIDPKLFNAQEVFAEVAQEKIVSAAGTSYTPKTNVPQGYDADFSTILHKVGTMTDFLLCDDPKAFLKTHHEIRFPPADRHYLDSKHSKKELVYLCQDLVQVGEADRRRLIRWREQLLREEAKLRDASGSDDDDDAAAGDNDSVTAGGGRGGGGSDDDGEGAGGAEDTEEDLHKLAEELLAVRKKKAKELKKAQRRLVDRKLKQVRGLINHDSAEAAAHAEDLGFGGGGDDAVDRDGYDGFDGDGEGAAGAGGVDDDWTIARVAAVPEEDIADLMDKHFEEPTDHRNVPLDHVVDVDVNKEEDYDLGGGEEEDERLQIEEGNEDAYDVDAYGNYVLAEPSQRVKFFKVGTATAAERAAAGGDDEDDEGLDEDGEDDYDAPAAAAAGGNEADAKQPKWQKRQKNIDKVLNMTFPKPRDGKRKRNTEEDLVEMRAAPGPLPGERAGPSRRRTKYEDAVSDDDDDDSVSGASDFSSLHASDEDVEINQGRKDSRRKKAIVPDIGKLTTAELVKQQRKQVLKDNKVKRQKGKKDADAFEEIPIALTDPDIRARTLAMATAMLDKKKRRDMMDNALNRYMNNDDAELPDWFIKDEQRNCTVHMPITAAEIEAQRQRFIELSSRPSKKVMEAMGRKRRRAQRMLRGLIEKGKTDPRARDKANSTTVRKLLRSKAIKGDGGSSKKGPMDSKLRGQKRREKQKMQRAKRGR